ncbi:DUF6734 family protein [Flavobacterium sp.]
MGKIKTYSIQEYSFLHVDSDVILYGSFQFEHLS